ncbi:MAG: 3'-5' exonuclease [Bacteroidales bacterium]|nr:3'-5' exonuclease [Bacteroidales bacterium]
MKKIRDKYDKKSIQTLPRVLFNGRIIVIFSEKETDKAVEYLMKSKILGVDTETRPSFKKGKMHQVSLLQISTYDTCFLFRLNRIGLTDSLVKLLEDRQTTKVGLSLQDDLRQLNQRRAFTPGAYIELQKEVKEIGIEDMSLQKIYANLFGEKIAKSQQLSNWEAETLSEAQQYYAATDAWACLKIHEEVTRLKREKDYILEITPTFTDNPSNI